jgi:hypothetical protein
MALFDTNPENFTVADILNAIENFEIINEQHKNKQGEDEYRLEYKSKYLRVYRSRDFKRKVWFIGPKEHVDVLIDELTYLYEEYKEKMDVSICAYKYQKACDDYFKLIDSPSPPPYEL